MRRHLGVVHIGESGEAEPDYDSYYQSRGSRYRDYSEHDEEEEFDGDTGDDEDASFEAVSVDDTWQYVDEWRDTDDRAVEFGRIPVTEGELLPAGALDKEPADQNRLTEATGNEGATYERSYHRAALVVWPANRMADVLLEAGVVAALPHLRKLAAGGKSAHPEAMAVAQRIVEAWPTDARAARRPDRDATGIASPESSDRAKMLATLVKLNAPELLERFIGEVLTSTYDGSENAALFTCVKALGDKQAGVVLSALVEARMPHYPNECAELLLRLAKDPSPAIRRIAESAVAGLDGIGMSDSKPLEWWMGEDRRHKRPLAPEFVATLFSALQHFNESTLCDSAAARIASRPQVFNSTTLVVPGIERVCAEQDPLPSAVDRAIQHLWTSAAEFLLQRSEVPPQPPPDWRLAAKISCTCADCVELQVFARDPTERVHRFRVKKERRQHIHQAIDRYKLDMTHVTERVGSPQTLVCTKDRRTFKARMKEYQDEITAMGTLVKLARESALSKRMETAIQASLI